jgi:hypothetical protein
VSDRSLARWIIGEIAPRGISHEEVIATAKADDESPVALLADPGRCVCSRHPYAQGDEKDEQLTLRLDGRRGTGDTHLGPRNAI